MGYPAEPETLGEQLTKRRMDLGLTREQIARQIGVWDQALRNWGAGRTRPGPKHVPAIQRFLREEPLLPAATLGNRLRDWRRANRVSKAGAARLAGLHEQTIAHIERGRWRWVSARVRTAIARLLERPPANTPR